MLTVTGYRIYRDGTLVGLVSGTVTSFTDATTTGSTTYSYTIAALDAAGNASAQSSGAGATTPSGTPPSDTTPPSVPTNLSGTPVAGGRIDLTWTASTDNVAVAGYNVYRDAVKINTVPIGSTSYSDTGLAPGVNHTYTISAIDAAGNESAQSGSYTGAAGSGAVTTTYSYDAENRLTQLQSDANVIGTYAYDGAGNRYGKTAGGVTTAYTLDLASGLPQVLTETAGSAVTTYAYGAGPLELDKSGTTYWYQPDTLGSVRLVTDSTGATPATYAYSAFGSTRTSTGTLANEVRFTGERTDGESGLEFLRARTYDPAAGTFLQRDSWGITPTSSQSLDGYAYTASNPVNATDPSGHDPWWQDSYKDAGIATGTFVMPGTTITRSGPGAYTPPKHNTSGPGGYTPPLAPPTQDRPFIKTAPDPPQGRPQCGSFDPLCDLNNALGTAGDVVGPVMPGVVIGGSAALCYFGGEVTAGIACLPFAGVTVYTAANAGDNSSKGQLPWEGWNWQDAATGGSASLMTILAPEATGTAMGLGFVLGFGSDLVDQQMQHPGQFNWNHAACSGAGGAFAAGALFSGNATMKAIKGTVWSIATTVAGTKLCGGQ